MVDFMVFAAFFGLYSLLVAFDASKFLLLLGLMFADRCLAAISKESAGILRYCNVFVLRRGKFLSSTSIITRGEKKVPFFVANLHDEGIISM